MSDHDETMAIDTTDPAQPENPPVTAADAANLALAQLAELRVMAEKWAPMLERLHQLEQAALAEGHTIASVVAKAAQELFGVLR